MAALANNQLISLNHLGTPYAAVFARDNLSPTEVSAATASTIVPDANIPPLGQK